MRVLRGHLAEEVLRGMGERASPSRVLEARQRATSGSRAVVKKSDAVRVMKILGNLSEAMHAQGTAVEDLVGMIEVAGPATVEAIKGVATVNLIAILKMGVLLEAFLSDGVEEEKPKDELS